MRKKEIEDVDAYPLTWPDGYGRTKEPQRSRFRDYSSFGYVRDGLIDELRKLGATKVIISTNIEINRSGQPYSGRKEPNDSGVAAWFFMDKETRVIACDAWESVRENMAALKNTVGALRGIDRWGASQILDRIFRGFAALPAPMVAKRSWRDVMGFSEIEEITRSDVKARFNRLAKTRHPDHGGDTTQFAELHEAYKEAWGETVDT
jgi:hypothetical protein